LLQSYSLQSPCKDVSLATTRTKQIFAGLDTQFQQQQPLCTFDGPAILQSSGVLKLQAISHFTLTQRGNQHVATGEVLPLAFWIAKLTWGAHDHQTLLGGIVGAETSRTTKHKRADATLALLRQYAWVRDAK